RNKKIETGSYFESDCVGPAVPMPVSESCADGDNARFRVRKSVPKLRRGLLIADGSDRVGLPPVSPAEAVAQRPVNEEGSSNDICRREVSPVPRIGAVHCVVSHDEIMIGLHAVGCVFIREILHGYTVAARKVSADNFVVHMAGIMTFLRRRFR